MTALPSGVVTFLFTDIEGSTRRWEEAPDSMRVALARHDAILESSVTAHGGVVFSKMGDGMVAVFVSATDAVEAAVAAQLGLVAESWPSEVGEIRVRMGAHTGDGVIIGDHYLNQPLNRCARLMAIAHGGQVLISGTTEPLVRGALPGHVALIDFGEHRLRDLAEPMRVFQVQGPGLAGEFPPLRSLESFLGNLPVQVSSFIGRERELSRGLDALKASRVVTLIGVGGVGKTRLAIQIAADLASEFRDGTWLVELAGVREPTRVPEAFASVFKVSARGDQSIEDALVDFLAAKQLLLVVDNCEHVLEPVGDLIDSLGRVCPGVVVLATSREGLAIEGEQLLAVPSLGSPTADADRDEIAAADSVVLFVERAHRVDADFELTAANASVVAQICRRLDGIPLAIELAAAQVRAMTPGELAQGLDRRFETLAGGRRRAVERHQTLRAAIDWSYELLSERERRLLARLSVFTGGCSRDGARAVCGWEPIEPARVLDLLAGLVDRSLVTADREGAETRYRLLETIREYGEERLGELGEVETLRARHAEHYSDLVRSMSQSAGSDQVAVGRILGAEHDNLLSAMAHAVDSGDVDVALRLLTSSWGHFVWSGAGYLPRFPLDGLDLDGAREHPLYPQGLAIAAESAAARGEHDVVDELCKSALAAAAKLDSPDPLVEWAVSSARAASALSMGLFAIAAGHDERAIEIARSAGLLEATAKALASAAGAYSMAGEYERSASLATEGLALARQLETPVGIAENLTILAATLVADDPTRARTLLRESAQIRATLGPPDRMLGMVVPALLCAAGLEDWDEVFEYVPAAIRGLHWRGERTRLAAVLIAVARAVVAGAPDSAAVLQGAAIALALTPRGPLGSGTDRAPTSASGGSAEAVIPDVGIISALIRGTNAELGRALNDERLAELRAQGQSMGEENAVALALAAVARAKGGLASDARD